MSGSLRRRLVLAACVWVLALVVAGGIALDFAFRASVTRAFDETLREELHTLIAGIETAADGSWWQSRAPDDPQYAAIYGGRYWQIADPDGRVERSRSLWDAELPLDARSRAGRPRFASIDGPAGEALRGIAQTVALPRLGRPLTFQVARSRAVLDAEIARFTRLLAIALGTLALALVIAVWLQVGYGLKPLRRLAEQLRAVRIGREERLHGDHPLEVQPLIAELDAVLAHNRRLLERARSSAADLAHALKTPLSVMNAELHAPGDDWRAVLARELGRTRTLIDRHLGRAATAGGGRGRHTQIAPVVADLLAAMRRIHAERGIVFEAAVGPQAAFAGEREDLEEMLGNLLDNAGKWARGRVRIAAAIDGAALRIDIDDDGPGLAADRRDGAVERGRRYDEMTPGSGLGLAIVGDIVDSYDGRIELDESPLGGLRATLSLPRPADPAR